MAFGVFDLHCDTIDKLGMAADKALAPLPGDVDHDTADTIARATDTLVHNNVALAVDRMVDRDGNRVPWCQCYGVWVPDIRHGHDAQRFYRQARAWFAEQMITCADSMTQVRDARQIDGILAGGKVAAMLTVENALAIGHSVRAIDEMVDDGVKMVTLTWNGHNPIGSGFDAPLEGLTTFGREAIRAFEDAHIVVDVSHLNDLCFYDFLDVARRPFVASHSNARAVCDAPRNLTDDEFRAIRDAGGLVGLNYYRGFIAQRFADKDASHGITGTTAPAMGAAALPEREVTFDELAAHIEHFLDLGGQDTIALGSDYDGADVPTWLDSCDKLAAFYGQVAKRFGQSIADKMFFANARDFFVRNETL